MTLKDQDFTPVIGTFVNAVVNEFENTVNFFIIGARSLKHMPYARDSDGGRETETEKDSKKPFGVYFFLCQECHVMKCSGQHSPANQSLTCGNSQHEISFKKRYNALRFLPRHDFS